MKKNEELLHITGDIDDDLIEKARPEKVRKKKTIKISVLSSAAVIALVLGMQYKFVFKPLSDAGGDNSVSNPVTVTSEVSETDIAETEITLMTELVFPYESEVYEIYADGDRVIKFLPSDDEGFSCVVEKSVLIEDRDSTLYYTFEEGGNKYYLDGSKTRMDAKRNFTVTENYFYAHLNKGLFSFKRSDGQLINEDYGFHGEMDLGYYDTMLGADNDENIYMLLNDYTDGDKYTLLKYSPELELLSSDVTEVSEEADTSDAEQQKRMIFDLARGFDSINLSDGKMNIVYSGDCVLEYDFAANEYYSDCDISFEKRKTDAEAGIYKGGEYLYAKDRNGETVLKCFFNIDENGSEFKPEKSEDGKGIYTYIDGEVLCGYKQEGTYDNIIEIQKYEIPGKLVDSRVVEDRNELITSEERKAEELCTGESGTFNNPGFPESGFPYYISSLKFTDNGDMLCTLKIGASRAQISLSREPEPEEKCHIGVISPSGEYREITEKTIREHMKSGTVSPSPQNDGTFVYIYDSVLYSYDVQKNETTALCSISNYYNMLTGDILKSDDTTYVLPSSVYDSNTGNFYILKLEEKQADELSH